MKNRMYMIVALLLGATALFTACSKSEDVGSNIVFNLSQEEYGIPLSNEVEVKVLSSANIGGGAVVDYKINSSLVEGEDYKVSEKQFTFGQGAREASVTITFLRSLAEDEGLSLQLTGSSVGSLGVSKASIGLSDADALIYTFGKESYTMTESAEVELSLTSVNGSFSAEKDIELEVELDDNSTAVEGVHFDFANGNKIVIPAGSNKGKIKLNFKKQEAEKDLIVLKLKDAPTQLKPGNFETASVIIFGSMYEKLVGAWQYKSFANEDWLELNTSYTDDPATLPRNNGEADSLIFEEEGLKAALSGDLKNYFRDTQITYIGEEEEVLQEVPGFPPSRVNIMLVNGLANVKFSEKENDEREAEIGFRVFEEDGEELLEVTIRDYEPVDFLKETYLMYKTFGDTPTMKSMPLRFHFKKVDKK